MKPGKKFGFVIPDNQRLDQDIFVPIEKSRGAVDGHKVVVELTSYGENGKKPEGKIVECCQCGCRGFASGDGSRKVILNCFIHL